MTVCTQTQLSATHAHAMQADFDTLKPSEYKDGGYRLRRYSTFEYDKNTRNLHKNPPKAFVQSDTLNTFQGNVARQYDDLTDSLWQSDAFLAMIDTFAEQGGLDDVSHIEVHQIRVRSTSNTEPTLTAPEGVHQDGFDRIGMCIINHHNIEGADLLVYDNKTDTTPKAVVKPSAGAFCVLDDSVLWHDATPIISKTDGEGYWDLFVLTARFNQAA